MNFRDKYEYLGELVAEKNRWSRPLTEEEKGLGFLGWHQRGCLPHCDYPGLVQFVTFRLWDSMPVSRRREWEQLLKVEGDRERRTKLEEYLDRGLGECSFREADVAGIMDEALLHFHRTRYELLAWCVMPNHVHVLVHVWRMPLWKMIRSWKQYVATHAGRISSERRPPARQARRQTLRWQREYWDTFMRDDEQETTAVRYIERNPVKARLCKVSEAWLFGSARFRDRYSRLVIPEKIGGGN